MRSKSTLKLVLNALFLALTLLLGMTPIGLIPLGAINVTILHIPVIAGTLFLGLKSGLLFGAAFGLCSIMSVYGLTLTAPSGLAAALNAKNIPLFLLMCLVPRLLVPTTTHYTNRLLAHFHVQRHFSLAISALIGSITNTIFYLGLMIWFYDLANLDVAALMAKLGIRSFWGIMTMIASGAGGLEALAAFLLVPPIVTALWKVQKQTGGSI